MLKTLELNLGNFRHRPIRPLAVPPVPGGELRPLELAPGATPATGWYLNPATGQQLYYDGATSQYYALQNGLLVPLGMSQWPGTVLSVAPGDTVRFNLTFGYGGPAVSIVLTCQVGTSAVIVGTFVGQSAKETKTLSLPANNSSTPVTYNAGTNPAAYVDVPLPSPGSDWTAIHADISSPSGAFSQQTLEYWGALNIVGITPVISGFNIATVAKVPAS